MKYRFRIYINNYVFYTDWYKVVFNHQMDDAMQEAKAIQSSVKHLMNEEYKSLCLVDVQVSLEESDK